MVELFDSVYGRRCSYSSLAKAVTTRMEDRTATRRVRIQASGPSQFFMLATLDNRAIRDYEDDVGAANRGRPFRPEEDAENAERQAVSTG
jgi:hypothetical protein